MKRYNIYLVLAIAAMLAASWLAFGQTAEGDNTAMNGTVPDFTVTSVDGGELHLSDYKGKVVLLNFWATWCPPCREEIPHFVDLTKKYGEDGFVVLGLSVDRNGSPVVKKWLEANPVNYPIAMSTEELTATFQQFIPADQRGGIPFSFILDKNGTIQQRLVGYRDEATWEGMIKPLL